MSAFTLPRDARALDGDIRLDGKGVDLLVGDGLVSFEEELSLVGSSVVRIGVIDPERLLVDSGLFAPRADDDERLERDVVLELDGVVYWLRAIAKRDDRFMLTFEDRTVCRLRDKGKVLLADSSATDHRTFVRRLCKRAGIDELVLEEPGERERRARGSLKGTSRGKRASELAEADERRAEGIDGDERLRVKSAWATRAQLDVASRLLSVARELRATDKAMRALIVAAIEESALRNDPRADGRGGLGALGAVPNRSRSHAGRFLRRGATDVKFSAEAFLRDPGFAGQGGAMRADRAHPGWSAGELAHAVLRRGRPATYDRWEQQAREIVEAFLSDEPDEDDDGRTIQTLAVIRGETYWDAAVRIGDQNDFVFFVAANKAYYLPQRTLRTSRPRMRIGELTPGIHTIDWEWAPHKRMRRIEVTCDAVMWRVPPGAIVVLEDDCGPAAGRWLVGEYRRSRFHDTAVVTLLRTRKRTKRDDERDET
ncbi:hypothetical protein VSS74_25130 [Conexibacter stalactiti]|uniref:DUF2357 domain-containing protein n=1 Tax=Conexibacter stalactiti TaxID=1940611 RepID=A0ABU4HXS6_9ACTN|nr:hypothetical protein [Conexibacter stalactiti]MDW5597659.1 hypothetical protein [Conexibacter stalactiti]MEC5038301.1 hypothetical protein [Conexibacter stalactiti]